jgi:hypothetical protein
MVDRVRAFKIERPSEGGTQDDTSGGFTEVDIGQDFLDCAGVSFQRIGANTATSDALVRAERTTAGALHLTDTIANGTTGLDLSQLVNALLGTPGSHASLGDIIHWMAGGGPGDGYTSGAYLAVVTSGIYPTSFTWYASNAANAPKLFAVSITYTGVVPAKIVYTLYNATGAVVRTQTDTLSYTNPFFGNAVRTWT